MGSGAYYSPEIIQLMKAVLEDATAALPEAKRTSAVRAEMACAILAAAGKGERVSGRAADVGGRQPRRAFALLA